jgi:hypoxanthine phosphoribosyltransferase
VTVLHALPRGTVLAPQAEAPRHHRGTDRSGKAAGAHVREVSWTDFDRHVQGLARAIRNEVEVDAVVGLAHGGVFVGGALAAALKVEFFPVRLTRRNRDTGQPGVKVRGAMPRELAGRKVLLVDDVSASGDALRRGLAALQKVRAKSMHTAVLLQRDLGYVAEFSALRRDDFHVFPWDYDTRGQAALDGVDPDTAGA